MMLTEPKPVRKRQNNAEKRQRLAADVQLFAKKYARKAQKGVEPNDRKFSKRTLARIQQIEPGDLDHLMRYEDD